MDVLERFGELETPHDCRRWLGLATSPEMPRTLATMVLRVLELWLDGCEAAQRLHRREEGRPILELVKGNNHVRARLGG